MRPSRTCHWNKLAQTLVQTCPFGYWKHSLTDRAVLATPALQAVTVPFDVAGEVSKSVVTGSAVGGTGFAMVVLVAYHTVGVTQLALVPKVLILGPFLSDGQPVSGRQSADEVVLVLWVDEVRSGENLIVFVSKLWI